MGGRAGNVELGLELLPPLADQRRRGQHEHAVDHAAQQILLEHHAGLDGLAEPDFIGEQHAAAKLLEHLAHSLDLVPEGFDAAQMRQAEQLVEALREAEMGKALAQAIPAAVAVRRLLQGGQQRREIELGAERDIDVDQRQRRQCGRRGRRFRCGNQHALAPRRPRPRPDRALAFARDFGGCALTPASFVPFENPVVLLREPCPTPKASGKNAQGVESIREPIGFQHRTRQSKLVLLCERQGAQ